MVRWGGFLFVLYPLPWHPNRNTFSTRKKSSPWVSHSLLLPLFFLFLSYRHHFVISWSHNFLFSRNPTDWRRECISIQTSAAWHIHFFLITQSRKSLQSETSAISVFLVNWLCMPRVFLSIYEIPSVSSDRDHSSGFTCGRWWKGLSVSPLAPAGGGTRDWWLSGSTREQEEQPVGTINNSCIVHPPISRQQRCQKYGTSKTQYSVLQ